MKVQTVPIQGLSLKTFGGDLFGRRVRPGMSLRIDSYNAFYCK